MIDVETTGFSAEQDRVVEIACLRIDVAGNVIDELHTLIDPRQAVGASFVHGLDESALAGAPTFADVAPALLALLDGSLIVAHNASFDTGFLRAELSRAGAHTSGMPYACTMALRRQVGLPGPTAHKLSWACWQEGIAIETAHAAVCDARATGALASRYLNYAERCGRRRLSDLPARGRAAESWAEAPCGPAANGRRSVTLRPRPGVSSCPPALHRQVPASPEHITVYARALDQAIEDFQVDEAEVSELSWLVGELGLTSEQVRTAHEQLLRAQLDERLADGLLTWAEQQELRALARLLGIGERELGELLAAAEQVATVEGRGGALVTKSAGGGLSVCFTGEFVAMPLSREEVSELAADAGMTVARGVSKKLDLLVCLDPYTGTSKLRKAAEYETVVIDQPTFLALAGVQAAPEGVTAGVLTQLEERRAARADADERRRSAAAETARERNRARAAHRRASDATEQTLWCAAGEHEWQRPPQRGRPPHACPAHRAA